MDSEDDSDINEEDNAWEVKVSDVEDKGNIDSDKEDLSNVARGSLKDLLASLTWKFKKINNQ